MKYNLKKYVEPVTQKERSSHWTPISFILILAAGLYFYELGTESLWVDELLSIDAAKNLNINQLITGKYSRPVYFILLHFWMMLGDSEAWLRGLCLLFSLGSVFLIYELARRLLGTPTATIAALIATVSPLFIHHAQEVRMYAPSTFFTVGGSLLLTYVLEKPTPRLMGLWAGARLLGILTTPLNLLMLLPDTVLFAWKFRDRPPMLFRFGVCLGAIGLLWLPIAIPLVDSACKFMGLEQFPLCKLMTGGEVTLVANQSAMVSTVANQSAMASTVANQSAKVSTNPGIFDATFQLVRFTVWPFGRPISEAIYWFYKFFALMLVGLLAIALLIKRKKAIGIYWLAAWGFLPLVPLFITSQLSRSLWKNRYLLFTSPYLFILLAAGIIYVWHRWRLGAIAIAFIYTVAIAGGLMRYHKVLDRADWRGLVQTIEAKEQPGDTIIWALNQMNPVALNHYYDGSASIEITSAPPYNGEEGITLEEWLSKLPSDSASFWLVCPLSEEKSDIFNNVLIQQFDIESEEEFKGENGSFHLLNLKRRG